MPERSIRETKLLKMIARISWTEERGDEGPSERPEIPWTDGGMAVVAVGDARSDSDRTDKRFETEMKGQYESGVGDVVQVHVDECMGKQTAY